MHLQIIIKQQSWTDMHLQDIITQQITEFTCVYKTLL